MSELDDLLARLAEAPSHGVTYVGLAVGKDGESLHVAVRDGVVAIPVSAITEVRPLRFAGGPDNIVRVDVSDTAGVRQIMKVTPVPHTDRATFIAGREALDYHHVTYTPDITGTATAVTMEDFYASAADDFDPLATVDDTVE
jgi:hypothetical protein